MAPYASWLGSEYSLVWLSFELYELPSMRIEKNP
jgi:hypothetical protein